MEVNSPFKQENSEYLKINPTWHVEDSAWKATQVLEIIERIKITPATVAEIGCGAGEILNQLHQRMPDKTIDFSGYEIAPDAFELSLSREKERLHFYKDNLLILDKFFDLLLVIDVFEHVDDYLGFIRGTAKLADYKIYHIPLDISVFSILINNFKYIRTPGGHIHYYNKFTALETLKYCGMDIIDYMYTPGALEQNQKKLSLFSRFLNFCRRVFFKMSPDFTANWFGGYSLIAITK